MANFIRPQSVTSGLVLCLDAANPKSYPTTGTTWSDLSGKGNHVTLSGGQTFSSTNVGSLYFNSGNSQYANFSVPNLGSNAITVEVWGNITSQQGMMFGFNNYDVWMDNARIGFNTGNGDQYGIDATQINSLGLVGNWRHYIFIMYDNQAYTVGNKIYVNGVSQTLGGGIVNTGSFNNGNGRISGWLAGSGYFTNMKYATFKIYNRALSDAEILQNFNAHKNRFGL